MDSLSLYHSEKAFGYALGINSGSEGIRRLEKAEGVCNVCLSCVSIGICERKGTFVNLRENGHVARPLKG